MVTTKLGEPRVCWKCRMSMRTGTLALMLPGGHVAHAVMSTCRRRARQLAARVDEARLS